MTNKIFFMSAIYKCRLGSGYFSAFIEVPINLSREKFVNVVNKIVAKELQKQGEEDVSDVVILSITPANWVK